MTHKTLIAGVAALGLIGGGAGAAMAAKSAPSKVTVKAVTKSTFKINRYAKNELRFNRDVYQVKSGGTLTFQSNAISDGPHTFSVVKRSDLPKTAKQINNCAVCNTLGQAHGADPNSQGPPKFQFVENGTGQNTPPNVDQPGDSALLPGAKNGENVALKVTAKKGKTLYFMCIIHPWMQAKLQVK